MCDVSTANVMGSLDRLDAAYLGGWIIIREAPSFKLPLEVLLDGQWLGTSVADGYRRDLEEAEFGGGHDAKQCAHVKGSSLAQAGDVLVWHADLAYGGAEIENPGRTRRSLVTHDCPNIDEPFYRRNAKHRSVTRGGVAFKSQYGNVEEAR